MMNAFIESCVAKLKAQELEDIPEPVDSFSRDDDVMFDFDSREPTYSAWGKKVNKLAPAYTMDMYVTKK
jgi:hypothetical protein